MLKWVLIFLALLLATACAAPAKAEPTKVAKDIDAFCKGQTACVTRQREALRYFLNLSVVYQAPGATMEGCMRTGKIGRSVDWTVAERCMRAWSKGKRGILPGGPG